MTWPADLSLKSLQTNPPICISLDYAGPYGGQPDEYAAIIESFDYMHKTIAFSSNGYHALAGGLTGAIEGGWLPDNVDIEKLQNLIAQLKAKTKGVFYLHEGIPKQTN